MIDRVRSTYGQRGLKLAILCTFAGVNATRIDQLEALARESPTDPFLQYALALEWAKTDRDRAGDYFKALLNDHPDYLPAYYQAALHFYEAGEEAACDPILEKGIVLAAKQGETKALAELRNLKTNIDLGLDLDQ